VSLSYAIRITEKNINEIKVSSEGRPLQIGQVVYASGRDDLIFVGYFILALMALRHFFGNYVVKPLARLHLGQHREMNVHKVAENVWFFLWYLLAFLGGLSIQYGTQWWLGSYTYLGGPADWTSHIWRGYPFLYHSPITKLYYLLEGAYWCSMIFVTLIEPWRSDTIQMTVHHLITSFMVVSSYSLNQIRIGTAVMVCQDLADIFLPLAKTFRYLRFPNLANACFALFTFAWIPTRHYLFFFLASSIWFEYDVLIDNTRWDPSSGYFGHWLIHPLYSLLFVVLQILMIRWAFDIINALTRAYSEGDVTDHRSGSESDEEKKRNHKKPKPNNEKKEQKQQPTSEKKEQ